MTVFNRFTLGGLAAALLVSGSASATVIDITLGAQDFADGAIVFPFTFNGASSGEPSPFDAFLGSDPSPGPNFSATWSYSYAVPATDVLVSASIELGILDHDSAHAGSQLASFTVDGQSLTAGLNALFEAPGEGANNQYDIYALAIPAALFASLADGTASFSLVLQGPTTGLLGDLPNNGAGLDFARLRIETRTTDIPPEAPEPGTALTLLTGIAMLSALRARRRRS
jgi:hypothetical protein